MKYDLESRNIHIWMELHSIANEQGIKLDFHDHAFLWDIYEDFSPQLVIFKAAQIGFSTLAVIKSAYVAKFKHLDIIYTLPTESDRNEFVSGKVNRIIAQNPILQAYTADKDSVEQKKFGDNLIYYRGTWTQKAAIMIPSDLNIYDEVDASKPAVIEQYSTRLQHSPYKWEWYFSHPSAPGTGVDKYWGRSDQKHWFIKCGSCGKWQFLEWPHNIKDLTGKHKSFDFDNNQYICKIESCQAVITDDMRRKGKWWPKYKRSAERTFSGYWIPLFLSPRVSAKEIIDYFKNKTEEYFYNKVLGLPYVGGGNKLTEAHFVQNLTTSNLYPNDPNNDPIVGGLDTGTQLYYVLGTPPPGGLMYYGIARGYDEMDQLMVRWPKLKFIVDQMGDLIGSRAFAARWPGRVFLCTFGSDRKTKELVRYGKGKESGHVIADRDRMISLVVSEFSDRRIPVMTTQSKLEEQKKEWQDYWLHWNNLTRIKIFDEKTGMFIGYKWVKTGQSDFSFATLYWRIGVMRFGQKGISIQNHTNVPKAIPGVLIREDGTIEGQHPGLVFNLKGDNKEEDWRI